MFGYLWFGCEEERTDMQREDLAGETDTVPRAEMPQLEEAKPGTGRNLQQKGLPGVQHGGRVVFVTMATGRCMQIYKADVQVRCATLARLSVHQ